MEFTAVYSKENIEIKPIVFFHGVGVYEDELKLWYSMVCDIPDGYEILEWGLLTVGKPNLNDNEIILVNPVNQYKSPYNSMNQEWNLNLIVNPVYFTEHRTVRARVYVIIKDVNGEESTIYSDLYTIRLGTNKAMISYIKDTETIYQEELEAGNKMSIPIGKVIDDKKELVGWKIGDVLYEGDYDSTEFINSDGVTLQEAVTTMINDGQETIDIVAEYIDKTELNKLLDDVSRLVETDYSNSSWNTLQQAIDGIDTLTKQSEIDNKVKEIQEAMNNLGIDKTELEELLEEIKTLNEKDYSKDSWKDLLENLENVQDIKIQSELNKKVDDIRNAINSLTVDKSKLEELIKEIENMNKDNYTKDSLQILEELLKIDDLAHQYEIDERIIEIQNAVKNLKVDFGKIYELFNNINKLNKDNFKEKTWNKLQEIVKEIEEKINNNEISVDNLDEYIGKLENSIYSLVENNDVKASDDVNIIILLIALTSIVGTIRSMQKLLFK